MRKLERVARWTGEAVRDFDTFGKQISLMFKGQEKFKTHLGGFMTVIVVINIIIYASILLESLLNKRQSVITDNLMHKDLTLDPTQYQIGKEGVKIGLVVMDFLTDSPVDDSYYDISFVHRQQIRSSIGGKVVSSNFTNLDLRPCASELTSLYNNPENIVQTFNVFCPKTQNYTIGGEKPFLFL